MTSAEKKSFLRKSKINNIKPKIKSNMSNTCSAYSKLTKEKLVKYILKYNNEQYTMGVISRLKMKELLNIAKRLKSERCNPSISKMKKKNMIKYAMKYFEYSPNKGIYEGGLYLYRNVNTPSVLYKKKRPLKASSESRNKKMKIDVTKKRPLTASPESRNKKMKIAVTKKRSLIASSESRNKKKAKELFSS